MNKLIAGIVAILTAVVGFLGWRNSSLKNDALKKEIDESKARDQAKDKATDALVEGLENENAPVDDRNHFG